MSDPVDLDPCYRLLRLAPEASLEDIETAYRKLSYQYTREGATQKLHQIKAAYQQIKVHQNTSSPKTTPSPAVGSATANPASTSSDALNHGWEQVVPSEPISEPIVGSHLMRQVRLGNPQPLETVLNDRLQRRGWRVQLTLQGDRLQIQLRGTQPPPVITATAVLYTLLNDLNLPGVQTVDLSARRGNTPVWTRQIVLTRPQVPFNRFSFENPWVNALAFPLAIVAAIVINASPLLLIVHPLQIWIHEFGHATVAWLGGRRALPLPFGWTSVVLERTWWVYVGILFLLAVLVRISWREQLRWPIVLGGMIGAVQFYMTWMMSAWQFEMWLAFGGIGGEFYLSTLLMIGFYFRFPDRWRWDFWRFVALVVAASTFINSFWLWHHIERGLAEIPWGSLFGGSGDSGGDMNRLNGEFGWSVSRIVDAYTTLGNSCLLLLVITYFIFLVRLNPHIWYRIRQQGIVWLSGDR